MMLAISGTWELRREGESLWGPVNVPGCWEDTGVAKTDPGPYWYRTNFLVPEDYSGKRVWLRFGAVSYACRVSVNGHAVGEHTGMWDAFTVEITEFIQPGSQAELLVRVEKPASLTAGPDSPHVPGNYPLRKTLSGFLPYVWGHVFGGVWQEVALYATGERTITDAWIYASSEGDTHVTLSTSSPGPAQVIITDPDGEIVWNQTHHIDKTKHLELHIPNPKPWSLTTPVLYTAKIILADHDEHDIRFGLRSFSAQGRILNLNHQPVYPRLILSWGWYADRLSPNPGKERVRSDMLRLRALGYNGVKLCLWFPPAYYFDLADELGMLLWVELPMWLPQPYEGYHNQTVQEYARLVRQARQHPSVVLYTLGCELSQAVDENFMGQLYTQTKELTAGALIRDNSGSSEAYYGPLHEHADFDDNHLYCELQYLRPTLDVFTPGWRLTKPWLMGEFCDYDTFPNAANYWWGNPDPGINPQGARWEMRIIEQPARLKRLGLLERIHELTSASHQQALIHRKHTIEAVRARGELSGYVITAEVDTPMSTAGMWDSCGHSKFEPAEFIPFNQDFVLALGWDRHRAWVAGGDRPSPQDHYNHVSGSLVRIHLIGSNFSQEKGIAYITWEVAFPGQAPFTSKQISTEFELTPGMVRGLDIIEFTAPEVALPRQAILRAQVRVADQLTTNTWPLWVYPSGVWANVPYFGLVDPLHVMSDLPKLAGDRCISGSAGVSVIICSGWSSKVEGFVKRGGKAILLEGLNGLAGPLPVVPVPYWREALKLIETHPSWGDFPHGNSPDMQFNTLAPDCALDTANFRGKVFPIYRRLDMRGMELLDYVVELEIGAGRVIATTLRFSGGLGDQPVGLRYCPAAQHLLANWVRSLHL